MKRITTIILSAAMLTSLAVPALAVEHPESLTDAPRSENTTVAPGPVIAPAPFSDVTSDASYADAVQYVSQKRIMNGVGADVFAPESVMTRAMLITTLWRMAGSPVVNYLMTYEDVDGDIWYGEAVRWAASEKILDDSESKTFGPNDTMTREEAAAMIYVVAKHEGKGFQGSWAIRLPYTDLDEMNEEYYEPVCWMVTSRIFEYGEGLQLNPKSVVTRAQAAEMLMILSRNAE